MLIIKRDRTTEEVDPKKVESAILKAFEACNHPLNENQKYMIADFCIGLCKGKEVSVETIQDKVENFLMLSAGLQDVAKATLDESRYPTIIGKLQDSTRALITGKVQDVVELTSKSYGFNQTEQESILDYLIRGGDMSLYGLSNAVTRASQDVESYDRATELESIGWDIVTMEPAKWKEINA